MCKNVYDMTYTDLNPRFLYSCIQDRKEPTTAHSHDFVELVVIMKGQGLFYINEKEYPVEDGNVVILNPGTVHYSKKKPDSDMDFLACHLGFTDVEYKGCPKGHMPLFKDYQISAMLPNGLKKEVFDLCTAIDRESNTCETGRYFMLKAYLIQFLCVLERFRIQEQEKEQKKNCSHQCEFKSINKKYLIEQITGYMKEHYQEKISLDQIAMNMYLSPYYISKLFKSETGDTPINYLISLRMKKARELLDVSTEMSIQQVAAAVGYEDPYHFSKLFKKYYGLSPLYYKGRLTR